MKQIYLMVLMLFAGNAAYSQQAAVACIQNTFYGLNANNEVISLSLSGGTITNNGVIVSAGSMVNSLAAADDFINGTPQQVFYSSTMDSLSYYDGSNWQAYAADPVTSHNAGGAGAFLYYQTNGGGYPAIIKRFIGTSLTTIFTDSTLNFTVADIGVTNTGNIFFFTGTGASTQFLHEISAAGTMLNTYPLTLYTAGAYGCFVMNNTIYIGIGAAGGNPNTLIPVTVSGGVATAGTGIQMPAVIFKDLAGCSDEATGIFSENEKSLIRIFPNPVSDLMHFEIGGTEPCDMKLTDRAGRDVLVNKFEPGECTVSVAGLPAGIYFARFMMSDRVFNYKILKL